MMGSFRKGVQYEWRRRMYVSRSVVAKALYYKPEGRGFETPRGY
jgi:hypothetical protein